MFNTWTVKKGVPPHTREGYEVTNGTESYWFDTSEWAWACKQHFDGLDIAIAKPIDLSKFAVSSYTTIGNPVVSEWTCNLFGQSDGISYHPPMGKEPNWFWRKMQYLILGFEWKRTK